jgi:signal transduction histidine kinase
MKNPYIILLSLPVLFFILHLPIWWFVAAISAIMLFIAYRFYAAQLHAVSDKNALLEKELEEVYERLEQSFFEEQKTNNEVEQERQLKKQFRSLISHKVLTQMHGIMGMAMLMAETSLTKEQQEYLGDILNCSKNLLATLNDVLMDDRLDFSKLEH